MAITAEQRRAICRVYVPGTKTRGTGFFIEGGWVLTAAHVVADKSGPSTKYATSDIELTVIDVTGKPQLVRGVSVEDASFEDDWAVLKTPQPVGAPTLSLRQVSPAFKVAWQTHGFPTAKPVESGDSAAEAAATDLEKRGLAVMGEMITGWDPRRFQLITELRDVEPGGLSGSPCIVDNQVVAMILYAASGSSPATLFARCVGVLSKRPDYFKLKRVARAYVRDVQSVIQDFGKALENTAAALGLAKTADEAAATIANNLVQTVAEGIMAGIPPALAAISDLQQPLLKRDPPPPGGTPKAASFLFELATRTWIDDRSVAELRDVLQAGNKIVILNTTDPTIANWYVHRASCLDRNHPGPFIPCPVDLQDISPGVLLHDFEQALATELGQSAGELPLYLENDHDHGLEPIVVWLTKLPERPHLEALLDVHGKVYRKLRIILLTDPSSDKVRKDFADAYSVSPPMVPEQAAEAIRFANAERRKLESIFRRANKRSSL